MLETTQIEIDSATVQWSAQIALILFTSPAPQAQNVKIGSKSCILIGYDN